MVAMICVHLLPSVLIGVEDKAIKNPRRGHSRGFENYFNLRFSLFTLLSSSALLGLFFWV